MNNRDLALKAISELTQSGIDLLKKPLELDDLTFNIWLEHSRKILELVTKDNPTIILNYLRLSIDLAGNTMLSNKQKMDFCLKYLIKVLEII